MLYILFHLIIQSATILLAAVFNIRTNDVPIKIAGVNIMDVRQFFSWIAAIIVAFVAAHLNFTIPSESAWYMVLFEGLVNALIANGLYKLPAVKWILDKMHLKPSDI